MPPQRVVLVTLFLVAALSAAGITFSNEPFEYKTTSGDIVRGIPVQAGYSRELKGRTFRFSVDGEDELLEVGASEFSQAESERINEDLKASAEMKASEKHESRVAEAKEAERQREIEHDIIHNRRHPFRLNEIAGLKPDVPTVNGSLLLSEATSYNEKILGLLEAEFAGLSRSAQIDRRQATEMTNQFLRAYRSGVGVRWVKEAQEKLSENVMSNHARYLLGPGGTLIIMKKTGSGENTTVEFACLLACFEECVDELR